MTFQDLGREPTARELRIFGWLSAAVFGTLGALAASAGNWVVAATIWAVVAAVTAAYFALPTVRRPLYKLWMALVSPIGWTVSHLVLAGIYYGMLTPLGLLLRIVRRDPMRRKLDRDAVSYWVPSEKPGPADYFKQF